MSGVASVRVSTDAPGRPRRRRQLGVVGADNHQHLIDSALSQGRDDVLQNGAASQRQRQLRPPHARTAAGGGDHGEDHAVASRPTRQRRFASATPRLRQAISSATMLTAISDTVCEPMSRPSGA